MDYQDKYSTIQCLKTGKILKPYGVTITTLSNNKKMKKMETQFGKMTTGDLDDNTMTFEIEGKMTLGAGEYAIVPIEDYEGSSVDEKSSSFLIRLLANIALAALILLSVYGITSAYENTFDKDRINKEELLLNLKRGNLKMKLEISEIDLDIVKKEIWILKNK
tara:strand:+ start:2770 stop:3258 length:489 start_codon:yes stop_codon:yes gene_type:complete